MNILLITISYSIKSSNIYSDLCGALADAGHKVKVAFADPSLPKNVLGKILRRGKVEILQIKTLKVQKVGLFKKGLSFLLLPFLMKRGIGRYFGGENFDLILSLAPPVSLCGVLKWAKRRYKCPVFLMQKDIFPQNAVDLGMFSKRNPVYWFFRRQEKRMLSVSDWIGCMSRGNIEYIVKHNRNIDPKRVVLFPNTVKILPFREHSDLSGAREKYGIPSGACVFLFGGNIGIPQNIKLLLSAMEHFSNRKDIFFLCIGSGSKAGELKNYIESKNIPNAKFLSAVPRDEYELLADSCDVGLVSLDPRFTIPNYPSKTLSYMAAELPILAATDTNTDYRDLVENQAKCGLWCDSSKGEDFFKCIDILSSNPDLRRSLGRNGRKYLIENFDVSRSVEIIESLYK